MHWDFRRSDWLRPGSPFTGPQFEPARCQNVIIHYIGTDRAPRNFVQWMQSVHAKTMNSSKPYAYMYNSAVDLNGGFWEGRGTDFRNAANKETNPVTWSICVATDGQVAANDKQVATIQRAVNDIRSFCGKNLGIIGHRDVAATSCPGAGVYHQLQAGVFEGVSKVTRISGSNRFETAAKVSAARFPNGAPVAYVANGLEFPDALSAATIATDGPLILTEADRLVDAAIWELTRLKPKRIVIVGGTKAISPQVEAELRKYAV